MSDSPKPKLATLPSGSRIAFVEAGTGPHPPVVLVHGSLCDYRYWWPQFNAVARHRRAIAISLPSYFPVTRQPATPGFSLRAHVDAVLELIDARQWGPIVLVGHSRGGAVAFHAASKRPSALVSLVLADPGGPTGTLGALRSASPEGGLEGLECSDHVLDDADPRMVASRLIESGDIDAGLEMFVDAVSRPGFWRRSVPAFKEMARDNAHTLLMQMHDVLPPYTRAGASRIAVPTLLINGDKSPDIFISSATALREWVPDARLETIQGASHGMNLSHPKEFNRLLLDFIGV